MERTNRGKGRTSGRGADGKEEEIGEQKWGKG